MIDIERRETVAVVKLSRGVTNALNLDLVNQLAEALRQTEQDLDIRGIVLSSSNDKFFIIGFDIPELLKLDREGMREFYQAFNQLSLQLYAFPKPTVAAITGHATAGGCILALCCDYRFIAEGRKLMGLNEVRLGVTVPYPADRIVRSLVEPRYARVIMEEGAFHSPEQSLRMGLVDDIVPLDEVRTAAVEKASLLGALPHEAWARIKRNRIENVEAQIRGRLEETEQSFLDCWFSDEAQGQLREAARKF